MLLQRVKMPLPEGTLQPQEYFLCKLSTDVMCLPEIVPNSKTKITRYQLDYKWNKINKIRNYILKNKKIRDKNGGK